MFAKNDSLVAQVIVNHQGKGMVFLLFRADQQGVNIHPPGHWKFLRGDHWTAAVMIRHHVGFVAVTPGKGAELLHDCKIDADAIVEAAKRLAALGPQISGAAATA